VSRYISSQAATQTTQERIPTKIDLAPERIAYFVGYAAEIKSLHGCLMIGFQGVADIARV
jgi:hypothetical protein